jgi:hypothetical protein
MSQFNPQPDHATLRPHRATAVLVLGILSLVVGCAGWILGIIAWTMANNDLRQMDAGLMDESGRSNTQAGKVCAMVGTFLHLGTMLLGVVWMLFVLGLIAAGAGASHR